MFPTSKNDIMAGLPRWPCARQWALAQPILSFDGLEWPPLSGPDGCPRGRESACLGRVLPRTTNGSSWN